MGCHDGKPKKMLYKKGAVWVLDYERQHGFRDGDTQPDTIDDADDADKPKLYARPRGGKGGLRGKQVWNKHTGEWDDKPEWAAMKQAVEESNKEFDDMGLPPNFRAPKRQRRLPTSTSSTSIAVEAFAVPVAASIIPEALPVVLPAIDPPADVHSVQPIHDAVPMSTPYEAEAPGAS